MVSMMRIGWLKMLVGVAGTVLLPGAVLAVDATEGADAQRLTLSLGELFVKGGPTMYALLFTSIAAVAFTLYLIAVLRSEQVVPRLFRKDVLAKIHEGDLDGVCETCNYKPNPLGEVTLAALDFLEANPQTDISLLKDAMQGEGERQALFISGPTQYMLDVAVIAPMLGLFGTVLGMMKAFQVVALDLAKAKPMLLAGGISEALITTVFGLVIGIPAMMVYAYFRQRTARLVATLEAASAEVLNALIRKRNA
ncbi:MAG: MotA/TolQ/ExbB proton channel family protein [Kiritimatiellia bacterium]